MRKFVFALPACAILLAGAVLATELGASASAKTPDVSAVEPGESIRFDTEGDPNATNWVETAKLPVVDSRKPKLPPPPPKAAKKAAKKK